MKTRKAKFSQLRTVLTTAVKPLVEAQVREKRRLQVEIIQIKGLMPLLMKPRNKQSWSRDDREEIRQHMRRLSALSPYLVVLVLPGSIAILPVLAWWIDRRRGQERDGKGATTSARIE